MIKLKSLYQEIKIQKPISSKDLLDLWLDSIDTGNNNISKLYKGLEILRTFGRREQQELPLIEWFDNISQNERNNLYQKLLQLKNS